MTSQQQSKHPDWDEIWEKAQNDDRLWLRNYIKSHDINQCTDEQGNTPLHHAARNGGDHISSLSNLCIDPNVKNTDGQTALQLAQDIDDDGWCREALQQHYPCIDYAKASSEPNGLHALFAAIYRGDATLGDTSGVKDDGNEVDAGGWTALHCAVWYDRPQLIHALHQRFPNLNSNYVGFTYSALHLAALHGHSNCIIALHKCFPAIKPTKALRTACVYNHPTCIDALRMCFPHLTGNELDSRHSVYVLRSAVESDNPECIRALHSCFPNIDPNLGDPLLVAFKHSKSSSCLSVLLDCFPNINPKDGCDNTVLMRVMKLGLAHSISVVATYFPTIDVNAVNDEGKTALMLAIESDNAENCITALCETYPGVIDPNKQDIWGNTALILATSQDQSGPIMSQLHKLFPNIDPNIQNSQQHSILMSMSCSPGYSLEYVRQFLDIFPNVDVNIQDEDGQTAVTLAISNDNPSIAALLLERFPGIVVQQSIANPTEKTALMLAIENDHTDLISQVLKNTDQID